MESVSEHFLTSQVQVGLIFTSVCSSHPRVVLSRIATLAASRTCPNLHDDVSVKLQQYFESTELRCCHTRETSPHDQEPFAGRFAILGARV